MDSDGATWEAIAKNAILSHHKKVISLLTGVADEVRTGKVGDYVICCEDCSLAVLERLRISLVSIAPEEPK